MLRFFSFFFLLWIVSSAAVATSVTDGSATEVDDPAASKSSFEDLLLSLNEHSIHQALHALSNKFRHGIFPTDTNAVEALYKENASLATQVLSLAKRSNGASNSTSSGGSQPTSTSLSSTVTDHMSSSTTKTASSTVATSSTPSSSHSTSTSATAASTSSSSSDSTKTSSTSTSSRTTFDTTTSAATTASSTTMAPYTSTYESTTTLPNGSLSTVTAVTIVHPTQTTVKTAGSSATPGLQTGNAAAFNSAGLTKEVLAMVGGAVAVALAL